MFARSGLLAASAVVVAVGLAGCTRPEAGKAGGGAAGVQVKGSDTMVQLAQKWAEDFMKTHPGISVTVTGGGSGTGIKSLLSNGTDIANASRDLTSEERKQAGAGGKKLGEYVVGRDALSIIVHKDNPINELTLAQLKEIYTGAVTNWKQLGGPDARIVLNSRETSSGTYAFFQEHVLGKGTPFAASALLLPATSQIVANVEQDRGGIGYVGLGYVTPAVKAVKVRKDAGAPAVAANADDVRNGSYPLARPLYEFTIGEPTPAVKTWLEWVQGAEGQALVEKLGFVGAR